MQDDPDRKPLLDMTPDGRFRVLREPAHARDHTRVYRMGGPVGTGLVAGATLAGMAALLAVLATFLAALVPLAIVAALLGRASVRVYRNRG